ETAAVISGEMLISPDKIMENYGLTRQDNLSSEECLTILKQEARFMSEFKENLEKNKTAYKDYLKKILIGYNDKECDLTIPDIEFAWAITDCFSLLITAFKELKERYKYKQLINFMGKELFVALNRLTPKRNEAVHDVGFMESN